MAECPTCHGTGTYVYTSTAMGMGVGGSSMTEGPCPGWRNGRPGRRPDLSNCPHWESPYDDFRKEPDV